MDNERLEGQEPLDEATSSAAPAQQSPLTRRGFLSAASVAALGAIAAACAPAAAPPAAPPAAATSAPAAATAAPAAATEIPTVAAVVPGPKAGGSIVWAIPQDPVNLLPFGAVATANHWGKEGYYDSLVRWDKDLNVQPALAESWETPDDKTYVFKLKEGLKFHDGTAVTADAVKYSLELQAAPPEPGIKIAQYPAIDTIEVVDPLTIKLNMKNPDPTVIGYLAWSRYSSIIPVDMYTKVNPLTEGIGTGPYKLVQYVANDRVEMTRNPDFWMQDVPYLENLTLKVLPDEQAAVAALRSGQIQGMTVSADTARVLANDPNIVVLKGLFSAPNQLQLTIKGDGKPWQDIRVRQAMNKVIDRQDIIDKVYAGEAIITGPIPPGYGDWFIQPEELAETFYKVDIEGAKALMKDAGFENGFDITLHSISAPPTTTQIAEIVKEQLKQININVTVQAEEIATFAKRNGEGNFDFCSTARGMRHDPSGYINEYGRPTTGSAAIWFNKGEGWSNKEAIELYDALVTTIDPVKRHEQVRRIQEIALTEFPHFTICQAYKFQAVRKEVMDMWVDFTDFNRGLRTVWLG